MTQSARNSAVAGKSTGARDMLILLVILIAATAAFLIFKEPPVVPEPASQHEAGMFGHGGAGQMAMFDDVPQDYNTLVDMGNTYMDNRNFPIAAEFYRRALAINGSSQDVRTDYGACLHAMGLPSRALDEFRNVLDQNPEHGTATYNMGIVHYGESQADSAKFYWEKYLSMYPNGSASESARRLLAELGN